MKDEMMLSAGVENFSTPNQPSPKHHLKFHLAQALIERRREKLAVS